MGVAGSCFVIKIRLLEEGLVGVILFLLIMFFKVKSNTGKRMSAIGWVEQT